MSTCIHKIDIITSMWYIDFMNELTNEQFMSVSEVATALSVSVDLVKKVIRKLRDDRTGVFELKNKQGGYLLNEAEVTMIKLTLEKNPHLDVAIMPRTDIDKELIIRQAMVFQDEKIAALRKQNEALQIRLDENMDWYTIKRIVGEKRMKITDERNIWAPLKRYSRDNGYDMPKVPDVNYPNGVRSYHKEVWQAVYGIDFD